MLSPAERPFYGLYAADAAVVLSCAKKIIAVPRRDKGDAFRRVDIRIQRADIIINHAARLSQTAAVAETDIGRSRIKPFDGVPPLLGLTAIAKMRIRSPFFSESDRLKKPR